MDFLDPKKRFHHTVLLFTGYALIGAAIIIGTLILLNEAYGFSIGKNGTVIQNGLVFFSSQPHPAQLYLNGKPQQKKSTNTSIFLPAGIYNAQLQRSGYRSWQRSIELEGGMVEHFDYPLLFPATLKTTKLQPTYTTLPSFATQSPDQRWVVVQQPGSMTAFGLYDLKNPTKAPTVINLPASLLAKATTSDSWQLQEWADDNQHVLLDHIHDGKTEYILLDRTNGAASVNVSQALAGDPFTKLTLDNKKYDQYYLYNATDGSLDTATLKTPAPTSVLSNVLAYQTYSDNTILYTTTTGAQSGKVLVKEAVATQSYTLRTLASGTNYLLDLTEYSGTPYVAIGAASENKVYIYKDPTSQLLALPTHAPVPTQVLRVPTPNYLSFSPNAQFIMVENGQQFAVYNIETDRGYTYLAPLPLQSPQLHATWMDGDRLTYVSGGNLVVFDYDRTNQQTLMPASPQYLPFFAPDYSYVYTLASAVSPAAPSGAALTKTSLYIPADQP